MPIYEYQCKKCGQFEIMQKITDQPLRRCPTCRAKVTKLISSTSFQLKGTGWYATDYPRQGQKSKESTGETKESKAETKEPKAEKTPAGDTKSGKSDTKASASKEAAAA